MIECRLAPAIVLIVFFLLSGCAPKPGETGGANAEGEPTSESTDSARFTDVAESAGLSYQWKIAGERPLNVLQTIGNGCAFLDYDSDGNLDILLVGPNPALYKGDGQGHFTDTTKESGLDSLKGQFLGCAVGDYDNDGFPDVYLTAYRGGALLHNEGRLTEDGRRTTDQKEVGSRQSAVGCYAQGPGPNAQRSESVSRHPSSVSRRFRDVTGEAGIGPQPWGTATSFADVDGDGRLDLFVGNYVKFGPGTEPRLCEYSGHMSACGPRFYQPERAVLYRNEGGRFRDVSTAWGIHKATGKNLGVAAAAYDESGRPSLALANDEMAGDLMQNLRSRFENIGARSGTAYDSTGNVHGGMGIDWGDYDNDGRLDLAVATFQHEAKCIYRNEGGGSFTELSAALGFAEKTAPFVAFGIKWLDFDNDGFLDLILSNGHVQDNIDLIDRSTTYRQKTQLFQNVKGERVEEISGSAGPAFQKPIVGRGLAVGDYDNDGGMDALIVDSEGAPLLLHNETSRRGHWLSVRLEGVKSNREGLGALVTAEAGGIKLLRHCATDGSYMSASDRRIHFGLGKETAVTLTVKWPSGVKSTYRGLAVDRMVVVREGEAVVR